MRYDPINFKLTTDSIMLYFVKPEGKHWFYEIYPVVIKHEAAEWDKHLKRKMWYTPEIRKKVLFLMKKLYDRPRA